MYFEHVDIKLDIIFNLQRWYNVPNTSCVEKIEIKLSNKNLSLGHLFWMVLHRIKNNKILFIL